MDNQRQQPTTTGQTINPKPVEPPHTAPTANPGNKPKLNLSDNEARALLTLNNLQATQEQPKTKASNKLMIVVIGLIVLAVVVSFLIGSFKPGGASKSSNSSGLGLPNQSTPTNSGSVSNNINQDVKTCSNPLDATLVC